MQLSHGSRTARATNKLVEEPNKQTNRDRNTGRERTGGRAAEEEEGDGLSTGVALRDYLPKNGAHVVEFSLQDKVKIIGGGRGAGVGLGRPRERRGTR